MDTQPAIVKAFRQSKPLGNAYEDASMPRAFITHRKYRVPVGEYNSAPSDTMAASIPSRKSSIVRGAPIRHSRASRIAVHVFRSVTRRRMASAEIAHTRVPISTEETISE